MPARLTVLSSRQVGRLRDRTLEDCLAATEPDAVLLADTDAIDVTWVTDTLLEDWTVLTPDPPPYRANSGRPAIHTGDSVDIVVAASTKQLEALAEIEADGTIDETTETYVITDGLDVEIRPTQLRASLDGREAYTEALPEELSGSYTHLTVAADPGYRREWGGLRVVGAGTDEESVATLMLHEDGTVAADSLRTSRLGLRAVDQVGEQTEELLRDAGFTTRPDLAAADVPTLRELGIGRGRSETMLDHARAITDGEVVVTDRKGFPETEPVFVDIETDGLTPTAVWLIGVLDRTGESGKQDATAGRFLSFLQRDSDASGEAVESFLQWYEANAAGRPVVAYNGSGFDFPVLDEHVTTHCPKHRETWANAPRFDPFDWASRQGHALLPGRTNTLDDVAGALGWESDETGLSGGAVARKYRRWCQEQSEATELDWDRHLAYCEDDVRALAHVYDALAAADETTRGQRATEETGTQGTLGDFS